MKRLIRSLLTLIAIAGIVLALWPLGQAAYGRWSQHQLQEQWQQSSRRAASSKKHRPRLASHSKGSAAARPSKPAPTPKAAPPPWPSTRLIIPEIGVDAVVVQGWDDDALRRGPGHDPRSVLPGAPGNCVIAAHRNVYGAWFSRVNELWAGSEVKLRTPDETYTYRVIAVYAVADSDTRIRQSSPDPAAPPQLTLITCTVPHTPSRIVATAHLVTETE